MYSPFVVGLTLALALGACGSKQPTIAAGKGLSIPTAEVQARIDGLPPAERARLESLDLRRRFVEEFALGELLAREAVKAGLKNGTGDAAGKKKMIQQFLMKRFGDPELARSIPEEELRRYYDENLSEFVQPLRLGVLSIEFTAPEGAPSRKAQEALARRIRAQIAKEERPDPDDVGVFLRVAGEVASPEAGITSSDRGPMSREEVVMSFSPEIAEQVWKGVGNRTSEVLATPAALYILKLKGGVPPRELSFEQAREVIAARLQRAKAMREYQELVKELRGSAGLVIDEAELTRLSIAGPPTADGSPDGQGAEPTAAAAKP